MNNSHERKGFTFYRSFDEAIEMLPEAEQLVAYKIIIAYSLDGIEPNEAELPFLVQMLWRAFKPNLDADRRRYDNGCKGGAPKGNTNACKNNRKTTNNQPKNNQETTEIQPKNNLKTSNVNVNENANVNVKENENVDANVEENKVADAPVKVADAPKAQNAPHFEPPTIVEIENYIQKQGYTDIDAHSFADYYASVGWRVGGQPMHDWQAALRRWHTRNKQTINHLKPQRNEPKNTSHIQPKYPSRGFQALSDEEYLRDASPRHTSAPC